MANTDIPIKEVVNVSITTTPTAPSRAGFGTLMLATKEAVPGLPLYQGIKYYGSLTEVAADWVPAAWNSAKAYVVGDYVVQAGLVYRSILAGTNQNPTVLNSTYWVSTGSANLEAYTAANTYFSQDPKPDKLAIATRYMTDQKGQLIGGGAEETNIATWQSITGGNAGSIVFNAGGATKVLTSLSFAGGLGATLDAVASTIEAALLTTPTGAFVGCTFTHNGTQFVFTTGTSGSSATVNFCTDHTVGTPIATMLQMKQGQAVAKQSGIGAETVVSAFLDRVNAKDSGWYALAFTKDTRDGDLTTGDAIVASTWVQANIKQFFTVSNNDASLSLPYDSANPADIGSKVRQLAHKRTFVVYSSQPAYYPEVSAFARAATTDFDFPNSTLTLKFKKLPGIPAEVLTTGQLTNLTSKSLNVYITVGGFDMLSDSMMGPGQGTYQDTVHGIDWLQNAIETNVFGYLATRPTKVPNTDAGAHMLAQQLEKALNQAVNNGLVAPGLDADDVYYKRGFSVTVGSVKDVPLGDRQRRKAPPISFICIGAGAIHNVTIKGLFNA